MHKGIKYSAIVLCILLAFLIAKVRNDNQRIQELNKFKTMIQTGDVEGVSSLIAIHPELIMADLGERPGDQLRPLSLAVGLSQEMICSNLIVLGANPNEQDKYRETPLHIAVQTGCTNCVRLLLAHGADLELRDKMNRTPLDVAREIKASTDIIGQLSSHEGK